MQTVIDPADLHRLPGQASAPAFLRVAVLCRLPVQGPAWGDAATQARADALVAECLTHFDYFPLDYAGPQAGEQIAGAFAQVRANLADAQSNAAAEAASSATHPQPFDAIVIAGGADLDSDIGAIHRVLAPCMRDAGLPVLCALGADDASTILGDSAWRVYPDPGRLLDCIDHAIRPAGASIDTLCDQVRSLAGFLVTEHEIEVRILRDAALLPPLQRHFAGHEADFDVARRSATRAVEQLHLRLLREAARLEQHRARIGVELTRAEQRGQPRTLPGIGWLRLAVVAIFVGVVAALWLLTNPATTVFFSGCALVVLSAAYVGIGNRIAERESLTSRSSGI